MIENNKEEVEIYEKKVNIQKIDMDGNVVSVPVNKVYIGVSKIDANPLQKRVEQVSKDYLFLQWIDDDTYIFGELSFDPVAFNYPEQYERNIAADMRYGILKLTRYKNGNVIPMKEKIISQAVYDDISQNNDKTVTVIFKDNYAYFDYEKGIQLTPAVLKHAVPFSVDYEGFAECSTKDKFGYLPRDVIPVTKEQDIRLLTEEQVKLLIEHQKEIDELYNANKIYKELTNSTYTKRRKYN